MAVTLVTSGPRIHKLGGAWEELHAYVSTAVDTIAAGDLIRITNTGVIQLAETASAGAIHGIALASDAATATNIPVLLFAEDTELIIQCIDTVAPEDLSITVPYTIEATSGSMAITATTSNGVLVPVALPEKSGNWEVGPGSAGADPYAYDDTANNNEIIVKVLGTCLAGHAAASS